jgi:hypothetical protein
LPRAGQAIIFQTLAKQTGAGSSLKLPEDRADGLSGRQA